MLSLETVFPSAAPHFVSQSESHVATGANVDLTTHWALLTDTEPTAEALKAINSERDRQRSLFGDQRLLDGTNRSAEAIEARNYAQWATDAADLGGALTWRHVLEEEFREALAEDDLYKLREEVTQIGAVACQWLEDLNRRIAEREAGIAA